MPDEKLDEIKTTPEMIEAGTAVVEEFTATAGGLTNSAAYVALRVYQAMERQAPKPETMAI